MADETATATPPYTDAPPPDQQGPTNWTAAAAGPPPSPAGAPPPSPSPAQAALTAGQNPDRSQVSTMPQTTNAGASGGVPLMLRPSRGGMLGVVDKIADALTGTTRPEIYKDDQGNEFVYHPNLSRGQQWARIGAELGRGAAAGYAAGRGAGGEGRAALAGFQVADQSRAEGKQEENEMEAKVRGDMIDKATMQHLQMQMAEEAWKAARMKVTASQEDVKYNDYQIDRIRTDGGEWIGDATSPGDIAGILQTTPNVMNHLVETGQLRIQPNLDPNGKHIGIKAYLMPEKYGKEMLPPGSTGHNFNPVTGDIDEFQYSDSTPKFARDVHDAQAFSARMKYQTDKATLEQKQQETAASKETVKKSKFDLYKEQQMLPLERAHMQAETDAANFKVQQAKANKLPMLPDGRVDLDNVPPADVITARQIAKGDQKLTSVVGRGSPEVRKYWMQLAEAIDPTFTEQKFDNRLKVSDSFADGDDADSIVSFNQFAAHAGAVNNGIQAMRNATSPMLNVALNKIATKAKGDPVVSSHLAPISASRTEFFNFLNNDHALQSADKEEARNQLNENMSPAQMQESVRSMLHTAADRFIEKNNKYKRTFGVNFPNMMTAETARIMRQFGFGSYVDQLDVMGEPAKTQQPGPGAAPTRPAGAVAIQPMNDGKRYYLDANGKNLGLAQE